MPFLHFDDSIKIMKGIEIKNYKKSKPIFDLKRLGYILAEDIISDHNSPRNFPHLQWDGYAVKTMPDLALGKIENFQV